MKYLRLAQAAAKDRFAAFLEHFRKVIMDKWPKMTADAHDRSLWLIGQLVRNSAICSPEPVEACFLALMRQVAVGSLSTPNIWLVTSLVELFTANLDWVKTRDSLLPYVVYTFLSVLNDHSRPDLHSLRDRESRLCATLIAERFDAVKVIGRDLVRLLQATCSLPDIENVFRSVLSAAVSGTPPADFDPGAVSGPLSNIRMLLACKTPKVFLESRLTPHMESWLNWMMLNVKMGNQNRYQRWFQSRFLSAPESETLLPEIIRFVR